LRTGEVVVKEVGKTHHAHTSVKEHVHVGDVAIQRVQALGKESVLDELQEVCVDSAPSMPRTAATFFLSSSLALMNACRSLRLRTT
jgi:hypothetical protein